MRKRASRWTQLQVGKRWWSFTLFHCHLNNMHIDISTFLLIPFFLDLRKESKSFKDHCAPLDSSTLGADLSHHCRDDEKVKERAEGKGEWQKNTTLIETECWWETELPKTCKCMRRDCACIGLRMSVRYMDLWVCACLREKRLNVEKSREKQERRETTECLFEDKFYLRLVKGIMSRTAKETWLNSDEPRTLNKKIGQLLGTDVFSAILNVLNAVKITVWYLING